MLLGRGLESCARRFALQLAEVSGGRGCSAERMSQNDAWKREFIWQIYQTIESGYCEKKIELSSGQFRNCCRNWPRRRLPKTKQRESRWRQKEKFADLKRYSIVIATLALGHTSNQKAAQKECSPQRFLSLSLSVDAQNDSRNERLPDWESQFEIATNRRPSISLLKFWRIQFENFNLLTMFWRYCLPGPTGY